MTAKPKPKKQKRSERKQLDDECRALLRQIVVLRDGGCITPGAWCTSILQHSHYHSATRQRIRYDLRNVHCQCSYCNKRHSFPGGRAPYEAWMNTHYPQTVILELAQLAELPKWQWSIPDLHNIRDALKIELERMQNEKILV